VNTYPLRYQGFQTYKVDGKYRVSVPPLWRPEGGAPLFLQISTTFEMPFIRVLSHEAYEERVQRIMQSDNSPGKKQAQLGKLAMHIRETNLNEQGKLLIPKELSVYAGIQPDSEIRLAGRGMHFEIWNKENHQRLIDIELNTKDEADDELGIF
jgi:DNA-binding transcriptional regulator/RsmH inhibitor MraZ